MTCLGPQPNRFRDYEGCDLASMVSRLDKDGVDLLCAFLKCNPDSRISSSDALEHQYFTSILPKEIKDLAHSDSIFSLPEIRLVREECSVNCRPISGR